MITWLVPWAFAAVTLLAGPVLVHMLLRRHARRVVFPATHLLATTRAAAVRFRRPSDAWLLLVRLLIVAVAVAAAARPLFLTPWRISQWDGRTTRAVVVDTSRGMPAPDIAAALAQQEMSATSSARRYAGADVRETVGRAAAWLAAAPPSRREIVVISHFPRGTLDAETIAAIRPDVGVRLVRAGSQPAERSLTPPPADGWRGAAWQPSLLIDTANTRVTWTRQGDTAPLSWLTPVTAPAEAPAAERALRAAASFGVAAGDASRRAAVVFAGGQYQGRTPQPVRTPWMVPAVLALRDSPLLRETATDVTMGESDGVFVVATHVAATSASAPAVLRAVMLAVRPASLADAAAEIVTLPDAELAAWGRPAAPVTGRAGVVVDEGDARWFWIAALILLLVEGWIRRAPRGQAREEVVHADAA